MARIVCALAVAAACVQICTAGIRGNSGKESSVNPAEERLLWRNRTANGQSTSSIRPGLISTALGNSTLNLEQPENDSDKSPGDAFEVFNVSDNFTNMTERNTTINTNTTIMFDDNTTAVLEEPTQEHVDLALLEEFPMSGESDKPIDENEKQDCLWRVLTGTSCTSQNNGNIVNGQQHDYLVADGACRYNDFLGYYQAGCQKPALENESTFPGLMPTKANVVLQKVFCADAECSVGCHSNAIVRSEVHYASNFCYLNEGSAQARTDSGFSFEFIGGCLDTENCNVIE